MRYHITNKLLPTISLAPDPWSPAGATDKPSIFSLRFVLFSMRFHEVRSFFFFFTPKKLCQGSSKQNIPLAKRNSAEYCFFLLLHKDLCRTGIR